MYYFFSFSFMYTLLMVTMLAVILLPYFTIGDWREPGAIASNGSTAMGSFGRDMGNS